VFTVGGRKAWGARVLGRVGVVFAVVEEEAEEVRCAARKARGESFAYVRAGKESGWGAVVGGGTVMIEQGAVKLVVLEGGCWLEVFFSRYR
jgi:hypothetical protein